MSVTGKQFYDKVRGLRSDLSSGITSEILNKVCDDPSVQPFLKWFCKNVSSANILSDEEIKLKNAIHDAGEWCETLEKALEESTKDCADLLRLVDGSDDKEDLLAEHEELQENCKEDEEYLCLLRQSLKNLKEVENKLDDDIEEAETMLEREQIEVEKAYDDCSTILKEFHKDNCQFFKDVESLLSVYANAAKNQGNAILWSQMPIDLFIKQMELYNHYLEIHVKKQFGNTKSTKEQQNEDSDYASLMNDSKEKQVHERMHEIGLCKTNLIDSKMQEMSAAIHEKSLLVILQCVQDIYNNGILKIPKDIQLQDDIQALNTKRDFLEQSIEVLRDQQIPEVTRFADMEMLKTLKNDALARLERRKSRLEKLETSFSLAAKHGHAHVDLLCVLMEMQRHCLHEVTEFIADARHYITTEYNLSSTRCEIMRQQQDEYTTLTAQSADTYNVFNEIFISMMLGNDSTKSLSSALKRYDDLLIDNAEKKKSILQTYLNNKIDNLKRMENKVDEDYMAEVQSGPTISLKPVSYEISSKCEEISALVRELQEDITRIRSLFKERVRMDANLEREKDILWQRFLADSDTLRMKYEEAQRKASESHFGDSSEDVV